MGQWFGELVAHADFLHSTCLALIVRPICEGSSLLLRVILAFGVQRSGQRHCIRHIGGWQLELRLLLECRVGARCIGGEREQDILLVVLLDLRRERLECGKDEVGDGEGLLLLWLEGFGESDLVEVRGAGAESESPT